jgi:hypothetical protein
MPPFFLNKCLQTSKHLYNTIHGNIAIYANKERIMIKDTLLAIIIGVVGALIIAEWAVGCGEAYTDSKGQTHQQTCVFVR